MKNIFEMSNAFATNMEKAITLAWNGDDLSGYEKQKDIAFNVVEYLKRNMISGKAVHLTKTYPTSIKWQEYGGLPKSLSKTDIIINDVRMSLKTGSAQLMSGGKEESKATMYSVIGKMKHKEMADKVLTLIDQFISGIANDTVGKARKNDEYIRMGDEIHKKLDKELKNLFNSDEKFKIDFLKEAISGEIKFGKVNDACANYILSIKDNKILLKYINEQTVKEISKNIKINVSYKTDYMKGKNIGKYSYRSVLRILVDKISEEYSKYDDKDIINENILTNVWEKIKEFFYKLLNDIKEFLYQNAMNIFYFLELEPEINIEGEIEI